MKQPLKKKIINDMNNSCTNVLQFYENMPLRIDNMSRFIAEYGRSPHLTFLMSIITCKSSDTYLEKKLYKYRYPASASVKNQSINVVLKDLLNNRIASEARKEIERRFAGQEYSTQIKILNALFAHNKISARLAIRLMAQNNIWEDWAIENIIKEFTLDKGITSATKQAGIELVIKNASKKLLLLHQEFVDNYAPYYYRCMNGFEKFVDKSRLFPMEYLDCYFSNNSTMEETEYSRIYIGTIKREILTKKYLEIRNKKSWCPSLVSLVSTQVFLALAANHDHKECICWWYALDRDIQNYIKDNPSWKTIKLGLNSSNEEIARVMECFYSCVLEYIDARKMNDDISDFRLTMTEPIDKNLPF